MHKALVGNEIIKLDRQLHLKTSSNTKPSGKDCRCYSIHNQTPKMGRTQEQGKQKEQNVTLHLQHSCHPIIGI